MRNGYTLLELIMSIAITAILLMGMSASILIAGRAVGDGVDTVGQTLRTSDVLGELASDISSAEVFQERASDSVTMTVQDRDGDGQGEIIRYRWTGASDARLMRQINDEPEVALAEDVQQFSLSFGTTTMAGENQDEPEKVFTGGRSRRPFWDWFWDHVVKKWVERRHRNGNGGNNGNNGNGGGNGNNGNGGGNGNGNGNGHGR